MNINLQETDYMFPKSYRKKIWLGWGIMIVIILFPLSVGSTANNPLNLNQDISGFWILVTPDPQDDVEVVFEIKKAGS
jgi:hypothetical protein